MLNQSEKVQIEKIVKDFTNQNEMFTAFDVTSTMRNTYGLNVFHKDVNVHVYSLFSTDTIFPIDYTRTFRVVKASDGTKAWVFHSETDDVSKYDPNKHGGTVDGPFNCDKRGRNCVTAKWIKKLVKGMNQVVFVEKSANQITVSAKINPNGKTYKVDKSWNVRISDGFKKYKIKSYKDCLILVKA